MKVTVDGAEYVSLPEDAPIIYDQIFLTLYRASLFHKVNPTWRLHLSEEELLNLQNDERIYKTTNAADVANRVLKGVALLIEGESLS